jgi:hypothetical protein
LPIDHMRSGAVEKLQELPHIVGREQWGLRTIGLMDFDSKFPKRGGRLNALSIKFWICLEEPQSYGSGGSGANRKDGKRQDEWKG